MALDCINDGFEFSFSADQTLQFGGVIRFGGEIFENFVVFEADEEEIEVECDVENSNGTGSSFTCSAKVLRGPFDISKIAAKFSLAYNNLGREPPLFQMGDVPIAARDEFLCNDPGPGIIGIDCACVIDVCFVSFDFNSTDTFPISRFFTAGCTPPELETNFFSGLVLYVGSGFVGILAILLLFIVVLRVQLTRERKKVPEAKSLELFVEEQQQPTLDIESDTFSLFTGLTQLQRKRSFGSEFSNMDSVRSEVTAKDEANNRLIKSVISKQHSEFSQVSQAIITLAPLMSGKDRAGMKKVVQKVSQSFEKEMLEGDDIPDIDSHLKAFNIEVAPEIAIDFYIQRLVMGLNFWYYDEEEFETGVRCLLLSLHYLAKLKQEHNFQLSKWNIHKILAVTMLVSGKFIEDAVISNEYWATIAGIELDELNGLEEVLCFSIGFDFTVSKQDLEKAFVSHGILEI